MKAKEEYTKSVIAGSTFQIDIDATVNTEKQKEIKRFIEDFRIDNMNGRDVSKYLTQNFFHSKMLQKRRLDSVGVTIKEKFKKNILRLFNEGSAIWLYDGKNVACNITDDDGKRLKEYFMSNSKKLSIKEKRYLGYSIITNASGSSEKIKCSNCGHECSITSFFSGCEFCRTKFNFSDFSNRISSTSLSVPEGIISSGFMKILVYGMLPLTIWANAHFGFVGNDMVWRIVAGIFLYFPVMIAVMILLLPFLLKPMIDNKRKHAIGKKMEKYDKYFSREHFFGVINHRLSIWAFCDKNDPLLQSVNNFCLDEKRVVDIDIVHFYNMLLKEEGENLVIHCICDIRLVYLSDNNIQEKTGKYELVLARNKHVETDLNFSFQKIKCRSCGASISLLENFNVCQSCRNVVNLINHDWVMTQITKQQGE